MHIRKRQNELSLFAAALEAIVEGVLITNRQGKIVYYNHNFLQMWEIPARIFNTHDDMEMQTFLQAQLVQSESFLTKIFSTHTPAFEDCEELFFKNGKIFTCNIKPHYVNSKLMGQVIRFTDITEQKRHHRQLLDEATHDPLTGLPNRKLLNEYLHQAVGYAHRAGLLFAVLFVDLDYYKLINDSFGHIIGDSLLKEVAQRLQSSMRDNDVIGRLGGDEFVILVSTVTSLEDVIPVARKILSLITEPFQCQGYELKITASIGISCYSLTESGFDPEVLIKQADEAMYCAKKLGRNNFQFYS